MLLGGLLAEEGVQQLGFLGPHLGVALGAKAAGVPELGVRDVVVLVELASGLLGSKAGLDHDVAVPTANNSKALELGLGGTDTPAVTVPIARAAALILEVVELVVDVDDRPAVEGDAIRLLVLSEDPGIAAQNRAEEPVIGSGSARNTSEGDIQVGFRPVGGLQKVSLSKRKGLRHAGVGG